MAHELLAARAARVRRIRQRVIAGTVAAFALAWGVVAFDGSMGTTATAQVTTESTTSTDATTSTDDTSTYSDDTTTSSATSDDDSSTLSTSQS